MEKNRLSFILKATHQSFDDGEHETNQYERILHAELLEQQDGRVYNKKLGLHFEDASQGSCTYEIETDQVQVSLCPRLKKAEDFTRRLNYLYDWYTFKAGNDGRIRSIENKEELRSTWKELKEIIEGDYIGDEVEEYLAEIDRRFLPERNLADPLFQYFHFALLFPGIPQEHKKEWSHQRKIQFSELEREMFEETIAFTHQTDGIRHYRITGVALPGSEVQIEQYEGSLACPSNQLTPESATLQIRFSYAEHTNQWNFELNKITTN